MKTPVAVLLLSSLLSLASADTASTSTDLTAVPAACDAICEPVIILDGICSISSSMDGMMDMEMDMGDDAMQIVEDICVCDNTSFDVKQVMPLCAACVAQEKGETAAVDRLMSACQFSGTTYAATATALVADITVSATKPAMTDVMTIPMTGTGTKTAAAVSGTSTGAAGGLRANGALAVGVAVLGLIL